MADVVRIEGLQQLARAMREMGEVVHRKIAGQATGAGARVVKPAAVRNIVSNNSKDGDSVETGSLRDAVIVKKLPKSQLGDLAAAHIVTVRRRKSGSKKSKTKQRMAPHAGFVERGTVNMPAEPFLGPALIQSRSQAENAMKEALKRGISREAKRVGGK